MGILSKDSGADEEPPISLSSSRINPQSGLLDDLQQEHRPVCASLQVQLRICTWRAALEGEPEDTDGWKVEFYHLFLLSIQSKCLNLEICFKIKLL